MSELTLDYGETVIHEWTVGHDKLGHPYIIVFALDGAAAVWRFSHVCTTAGRTHRVGLKIGHDVVATDPLHRLQHPRLGTRRQMGERLMTYRTWHEKHLHERSFGERIADAVAHGMGSWRFIIIQTVIVVVWMGANLAAVAFHWDPYPFILLNLLFSTQAAYAAPIIMMSQNRAAQRDKAQAEHQWQHQDQQLALNTKLTQAIHDALVATKTGDGEAEQPPTQ
jgi:uncharacterized membrane protein